MGVHEGKNLEECAVLWHLCLSHCSELLIIVPLAVTSKSCQSPSPSPPPRAGMQTEVGGHINLLVALVLIKHNCRFDLCLPLRRALLILFFIAVQWD